jgi:hypothetical protein
VKFGRQGDRERDDEMSGRKREILRNRYIEKEKYQKEKRKKREQTYQ